MPALIEEGIAIPDTIWTNPQLAFIGDCLLEKKMHKQSTKVKISGISESGSLIWNIYERFNLQANIGSGQYTWESFRGQFKRSIGLLWSTDVKLVIFNVRNLIFSLDAQLGGFESKQTLFRYWQVSPALSYRMGPFTPYSGCAINRMRGKISRGKAIWLRENEHLGPYIGISYSRGNWFLANFEWRGLFEDGLSIVTQVRF